jgi:hypothetical protein
MQAAIQKTRPVKSVKQIRKPNDWKAVFCRVVSKQLHRMVMHLAIDLDVHLIEVPPRLP